ncbi:hypothetical protein H6F77_11670 [Microcoleus sp. FACHB-831]|uniref:hypothetical protein n=1 Tax=Microcoleus sp. FACHB-831 TaxID=2692827 RepID=UPI0016853623|nr:hypothetical protein [Microcoleus sp. FACHB-831]MBD1921750.1 hypothetical protein [Microcoleus sp. FACHB-831]
MFAIEDNTLASALYGGFANINFFSGVGSIAGKWVHSGLAVVGNLINSIKDLVKDPKNIKDITFDFFADFWSTDLTGALLGAGAVVAIGVMVFSGGAALGALAGGLSGLGMLAGIAATAAGVAINNVLQNPVGKCIRWLVTKAQFIYSYNWNATDEDIQKNIDASIESLYGLAGNALGTAMGSTICGVLPGAVGVRLNLANVASVWQIIDDDIKTEILQGFNVLFQSSKRVQQDNMFRQTYMNVRRWIKSNDTIIDFISDIIPDADKIIESWGEKESKPFTFAKAVEEKIDTIKDKKTKKFVEGFVERLMESCTESLIAISYAF